MNNTRTAPAESGNVKKKKRSLTHIDFDPRSPVVRRVLLAALAVLVAVVLIYQVAHIGRSRSNKLNTQTALNRTISRSISADGYVVREESLLTANVSGTLVPRVENGSKVRAGDPVAKIFAGEADAQLLLELDGVETQIAYYENISDLDSANIYENKSAYNQNISNALFALLDCINDNDLSMLQQYVQDLNVNVTKRQIAVGEPVNVSERLSALYARRESLSASLSSAGSITADRAGYYVDRVDGCENDADYTAVLTADTATITSLLNTEPRTVGSTAGKLITQFNWYLLCVVDDLDAARLSVGQKVNVTFAGYSGGPIRMQLAAINEGEDNKTALVFRCNLMNSEIASLRCENVKICLEEYSGYAVDRKALRTVDGEVGVYVQLGNLVRFRKVEIVYSDENVILASSSSGNGYLRLYDEIITEGTDLYDGKIIL
ncbi:MAG: hypothetical protein IJR51_00755 [Clostridia bacterium]|nr:hypothetical protein [Clostridia bacterium]MBQ9505664.1 hypothetical protein [Clostridia bacterium]